MLFSSYTFLLAFLPLLLLAWQRVRFLGNNEKILVLLVFSVVFYAWSAPLFLLLFGATILISYGLGVLIAAQPADGPAENRPLLSRRALLIIALLVDFLPLIWFKYSGFLARTGASLLGTETAFQDPALPLGISFYTFIQVAWIVSVYKGSAAPSGITKHALFSGFFPYVISGPIVRIEQMEPQFAALSGPTSDGLARGFTRFAMGLFKKVVIADTIAVYADTIFNAAEKCFPLTGPEAWVGAVSYTFQLYFDFSGYTDMAIGLGLMLGLNIPENFDSPYRATGIVDFWRRWHITLGSWLRDFLYIPLGGNRKGKLKQYRNLFLTMLIGGAWHGAGWTFILWGALHGLMLCINHRFRAVIKGTPLQERFGTFRWRFFFTAVTFVCIIFCWVIFRAQTLGGAGYVMTAMVAGPWAVSPAEVASGADLLTRMLPHHYIQGVMPGFLLVCSAVIVFLAPTSQTILNGFRDGRFPFIHWTPTRFWALFTAAAFIAAIILASRKTSFLYFQF